MNRQRPLGPDDPRNPAPRTRHGLTAAEIASLKSRGCWICGRKDKPLQVDHDHRHCPGPEGCRQCVRGALCGLCNRAIWFLGDSAENAARMAAYLGGTGR